MNNIAKHIEYLTAIHDCVILPGFGAFLSHHQQARIEGDVFYAPKRLLTFNQAITKNDGLLESSVARRKGIDVKQAAALVADYVSDLKHTLARQGHVALGNLGFMLQSTPDAPIRFAPSQQGNDLLGQSWLPTVGLDVYKAEVAEHVATESVKHKVRILDYAARVARYAAAAVVLVMIGFAASTPISVSDANLASLVPAKTQDNIDVADNDFVYTPSEKCPTIVLKYDKQDTIAVNEQPAQVDAPVVSKPADNDEAKKSAKASVAQSVDWRLVDSDTYCVVIASLNNAQDAADYVSQAARKGVSCGVLEQDGRYRIYAATAPNHAQAQASLNALSHKYKGVWICRR